eukprot:m.109396 g.109396  ORF g.109396 m.109396 type:complete len:101 (+) comp51764_c0_seq3:323-625(+)
MLTACLFENASAIFALRKYDCRTGVDAADCAVTTDGGLLAAKAEGCVSCCKTSWTPRQAHDRPKNVQISNPDPCASASWEPSSKDPKQLHHSPRGTLPQG